MHMLQPLDRPATNNRLIVALLLLAALIPYVQTLAFGFVMDDTTAIRANPDVQGWSSLLRVWTQPYGGSGSPESGLYRPVLMTVFALVWNAGGHWALWFHLLAVAMHMGATVLVWRLLAPGIGRGPAILAAVWFAVHPVHVEAVANVANSSEVLVAIWTCALALCLTRADDRGRVSWGRASIAGLLYLAAFLTKESGAVAPFLAMLWLWGWRRDRIESDTPVASTSLALARWWPVLVAWAIAASIVFALRALVLGGPVTSTTIAPPGLAEMSAAQRVVAMLSLGPVILRLLVWPPATNPHYGPTSFSSSPAGWALLTLVLLLIAAVIAARLAKRGDRRALASIAWAVVAFLPASNIVVATGQILSERTLYVASIGVAMLAGLMLQAISARLLTRASDAMRKAAIGVAVVMLVTLALMTAQSAMVWRTNASLFAQMIEADSAGYRGYWLSGLEARYRGDLDEATARLARAYALYPRDPALVIDYSATLSRKGDSTRAAALAAELMTWPRLRADPRAVTFYLDAMEEAFGPDSAARAASRLSVNATARVDSLLRERLRRTSGSAR